jgi:hypothetical protein
MSVVKHRCHGLTEIARIARAVGCAHSQIFVVVGCVLVVLLLMAGWSLPGPPPSFPDRPEIIERAAIRIRSARAWPEKVVLDTGQLTIPTPSIEVAPTEQLVARLPDEMTDQTRVPAGRLKVRPLLSASRFTA